MLGRVVVSHMCMYSCNHEMINKIIIIIVIILIYLGPQ